MQNLRKKHRTLTSRNTFIYKYIPKKLNNHKCAFKLNMNHPIEGCSLCGEKVYTSYKINVSFENPFGK